jgi:hypothetical protein
MRGFDIPNFAMWWPIFFYRYGNALRLVFRLRLVRRHRG